ncbi:MAG: S8 family serine peptidase [Phycisphaerales bacterium]|nr:S8 family serine peptidase [Phycisphaerales bacterium]
MSRLQRGMIVVVTGVLAVGWAEAQSRSGAFPGYGILPKEDTGALRFLQQHPEYDGRGVVVAIFDTGIDPGAPGLQTTPDGRPKIVDVVDGSGSGDVATTKVVRAEGGFITGLSGRKLKVGADWVNPSGEYRVGLKAGYELFPRELVGRLKAERRKTWDERQRALVTALRREIEAWKNANPSPTAEQAKERDDLELRLSQLQEVQQGYEDPGPVYDCVVFHDGSVWRAVIDTDEDGDLTNEQRLTNFRLERQYGTFGAIDLMNFAVNIYNDGAVLSIVCDSGAHGTHVAGIVAAYFPEQPELNGVAPGAQLVSVKIGDTRLGSTSVGTGEIRGVVAVLQNGCQLINMSYGGPTADPDSGRTIEIYSELVNRDNVIFVASAGNEGPALSTVGSPGATTEALFGVGAYVSPDMMAVQYSMRATVAPIQFTWSSRGPTYDGALGVVFSAPGAAIAPVPNWALQRNMLMNGTSMAAPNACGNIALLLSGLLAQGRDWTPGEIRRAFENTAVDVPGVERFALGAGLIQVDRAYEYLARYGSAADRDVRFDVRVTTRGDARGIYLREPEEVNRPHEARLTITPVFHEDADNQRRVEYELRCRLESTARWVECAEHLMVMHGGRRLDVRVDPTRLSPGVHYAEIRGFDAADPQRGPLFRVPITVIRPHALPAGGVTWRERLVFEAGQIERRFLAVPEGATWADVRVRRVDDEERRLVILHTVQLVPGEAYTQHELQEYLPLGPGADEVRSLAVTGGRTLELCLAQFWSSLGACELDVEVSFHGLLPDATAVLVDGATMGTPVRVVATLAPERLGPKNTLDTLRKVLRPVEAQVRTLDGERDKLNRERQIYELVLTYQFSLDAALEVTPRVAMTDVLEYEDTWWSQISMIFDAGKRWITTNTSDPEPVKLEKGDYTVRFHVRYDDLAALKKLEDQPLLLDHKLASPVRLPMVGDPDQLLLGGALRPQSLARGEWATFWFGTLASEALPKAAAPGDRLLGHFTLGAQDEALPGLGHRPGGFPLTYIVAPQPVPAKRAPEADEDEPAATERYAEALRAFKLEQLAKFREAADAVLFDRIAAELLAAKADDLGVLVEQLKRADERRKEDPQGVIAAADRVLGAIDATALAAHFGTQPDPEDQAAGKVRKEMEAQKGALVAALFRKARATHLRAEQAGSDATTAPARTEAAALFERTWLELQKWTDTTSEEYLTMHVQREIERGRLGAALERITAQIEKQPTRKEWYTLRRDLYERLGWAHWLEYEERWEWLRFPPEWPLF